MSSTIATERIRKDYRRLIKQGSNATVDIQDREARLILQDFPYPDGWQPQPADLLLRFPVHYPRMQPAVYIPKKLSWNGPGRTSHILSEKDGPNGWNRWCTHHLDWDIWEASSKRRGTPAIVEFVGLIWESLANPTVSNPVQHARKRSHAND